MPTPLLSPRGYTLEPLVGSSFTGADETPISEGGAWTGVFASEPEQFNRIGNAAVPNNVASDNTSMYQGITWPADQWCQANLTVTGVVGAGTGIGLLLRQASAAKTHYRFMIDHATSNNALIDKHVAGTYTSLVGWTQPFTDGDQFTFGVQGSLLFVLDKLGAVVMTVQDTSIASGSPGIGYSSTDSSPSLDNWNGGKFSLLAKRPPVIIQPILAAYADSTFNDTGTTDNVAASVSWQAGDTVLVFGGISNNDPALTQSLGVPTVAGLTFIEIASVNVLNGPSGVGDDCTVYLWKAVAASAGSGTITSVTNTSSANERNGISVLVFRGAAGTGVPAIIDGSAEVVIHLPRRQNNSMVALMMADFTAGGDVTVTATPTGVVQHASNEVTQADFFVVTYATSDAPGANDYGIANHTGTPRMSGIAVEILGLPGASPRRRGRRSRDGLGMLGLLDVRRWF